MKTNRVYIRVDSVERREDFEAWYEDGTTFLRFEGPWQSEHDKVRIFGRMGGEMGCIKPNPNALMYYIKLERWEYVFHTIRIYQKYFVEGMHWNIMGSLTQPPLSFVNEATGEKDVRITQVDFKDKGACFRIASKDVSKLRVATASVVAMAIKEEFRGLSEGEEPEGAPLREKIRRWLFSGKGFSYEQISEEDRIPEDPEQQSLE